MLTSLPSAFSGTTLPLARVEFPLVVPTYSSLKRVTRTRGSTRPSSSTRLIKPKPQVSTPSPCTTATLRLMKCSHLLFACSLGSPMSSLRFNCTQLPLMNFKDLAKKLWLTGSSRTSTTILLSTLTQTDLKCRRESSTTDLTSLSSLKNSLPPTTTPSTQPSLCATQTTCS